MHNRWTECISIFHLPPKVSATQSHPPPAARAEERRYPD
ncbi:hypothetical protein M087_2008 [Bacteroides fragilis str. S23 R14]|nr:hypothetical protein M117_1977 [Bacteroides fragilis str. 3774 T13]EYA00372.1 hypothetical protein M087_2008 [Bacteroides fragilis str. S23 R14]